MSSLQFDMISDAEEYLHVQNPSFSFPFFSKNDHRCYFCDFQDLKFLEIHHLDGNHSNNNESNVVPACTLCHRANHLSWVLSDKAARIGISHDLDQIQLNHIQRFMLVLAHHSEKKVNAYFKSGGLFASLMDNLAMQFSRPDVNEDQVRESVFIEYPEAEQDVKEALVTDRINAAYIRQSLASNDGLERLINAMKVVKGKGKKFPKNAFHPYVLLYNENIFTDEQIHYYLTLDEFKPSKWTQVYEQKLLAEINK